MYEKKCNNLKHNSRKMKVAERRRRLNICVLSCSLNKIALYSYSRYVYKI